ncbi:EAL domain-containing protein [Aquabacter sp. L1I39]|uniref:putative bifunctional diguanylate cyclase/phosphodiesterase n=1 Tax=Aquabacter sp. L1I39 TaxID=2820278 RepID=UPI001ADA0E9D|nr:EAL domain-containing protein [Aquabacter sp. L1I39]QTL03411.1 EAL domain-containing protein [Aquabacter sp. L1I39]
MTYPTWDEGHARRVQAMVMLQGGAMTLLGLSWFAWALSMHRPLLAVTDLALGIAGVTLFSLVARGRLRTATILTAHVSPLLLALLCLFDNPSPDIPRSTHLFFLPMAAGGYFAFRQHDIYLRLVLPAVYLVAFLVFALTPLKFTDPAWLIPPFAEWTAAWLNTVCALLALVVTVVLMHADLTERHAREKELRSAIARADFTLHFQPQVDLERRVLGAEALLRWRHPTRGEVGPDAFIALAEETGLIVPIGDWVLRAACAQLARWHARPETAHLTLAVNISASQFLQPDFVETAIGVIQRSGVAPSKLRLELTESMSTDDIAATAAKMQALREIGIVWSLDDLGSGYSTLQGLSRLPFGQIKIDQSFVATMGSDTPDTHIVEAVTTLSARLSLALVAEGVETEEQFRKLVELGCRGFQGYLFGRPMEVGAFEAALLADTPRA